MVQQFNDEVAQVAGRDINNTYHIHIDAAVSKMIGKDVHNYAVYKLLKTCDFHNIRPHIERIALGLYGSSFFKSLSIEQINKLLLIALEIGALKPNKAMLPNMDFGFTLDRPCIGELAPPGRRDTITKRCEACVCE